jgi:hypothetical protein
LAKTHFDSVGVCGLNACDRCVLKELDMPIDVFLCCYFAPLPKLCFQLLDLFFGFGKPAEDVCLTED